MRWIALIAATLALAFSGVAWGWGAPPAAIDRDLRAAAARYGVPYSWLRRVSWCESRWRADPPHNNSSRGLFQFQLATWQSTPYARHSRLNPRASSLAAAWMYRQGRAREWVCR